MGASKGVHQTVKADTRNLYNKPQGGHSFLFLNSRTIWEQNYKFQEHTDAIRKYYILFQTSPCKRL